MADLIYEETLQEQAKYLNEDIEDLRKMFHRWLAQPYREGEALPAYERAVCQAIYRIVKLKSACRMTSVSREKWRERAIELGSPSHLRKEPAK